MAICNKCTIDKPIDSFYIHSNGKPRKQCKDCVQASRSPTPKEKKLQYAKKYRESHYELCLERSRNWRKTNLAYNSYRSMQYTQRKRQRTPNWANLELIKQFYLNRPEGFHIDHIIPLNGSKVCGLHVENNLQYLSPQDNYIKGNRYG